MASYEVDPDALFSDEEDPVPAPSPKRARVVPRPPRAPSIGHLKLPSFGTASLSGRSSTAPSSTLSHSSNVSSNNPYSSLSSSQYSRPQHPSSQYAHQNPNRPPTTSFGRPPQAPRPYNAPPRPITNQIRGPMGRGRAATLPAHVTQRQHHHQQPSLKSEVPDKFIKMASILPESAREHFIQGKMREEKATASAAAARKRPIRRRRLNDQSSAKILANLKNSRKGTFRGLDTLLQATQNSNKNLIQLEGSRHRIHKPEKLHAIYAEATMTKEMIEREQQEKVRQQLEMEEERERIHLHFRQMRESEREERHRMAKDWQKVETVAAGMRHAYRLAKVERGLFGEDEDAKRRNLEYWGLTLYPVEEDGKVTELMTIHVEEI